MKIIQMNEWGFVLKGKNIITENLFGCRAILMQTAEFNVIFHIRADNKKLEKKCIQFFNENNIKKCVELVPQSVGAMKLAPLKINSKIIRYSPNVISIGGDVIHFSKLLKIPNNEINIKKSKNYTGIIDNRFIFKNLKIKNE